LASQVSFKVVTKLPSRERFLLSEEGKNFREAPPTENRKFEGGFDLTDAKECVLVAIRFFE
jgi:hypothetical protein